jgi:hypothetical protein
LAATKTLKIFPKKDESIDAWSTSCKNRKFHDLRLRKLIIKMATSLKKGGGPMQEDEG